MYQITKNNDSIASIISIIDKLCSSLFHYKDLNEIKVIQNIFSCLLHTEFNSKNSIKTFSKQQLHIDITQAQYLLANINEKTGDRKTRGSYYTPEDVTQYIIVNSFINYLYPNNSQMYSVSDGIELLQNHNNIQLQYFLENTTTLDPTCGAGEFLLNTFRLKIQLFKLINKEINNSSIIAIFNTIKGNDLNEESVLICKLRMVIELLQLTEIENSELILSLLTQNFTVYNFAYNSSNIEQADIIIGNPPYIEYSKLDYKSENNYGNIYADMIKNSISTLSHNGIYGLIVPLSYISTNRMQKIRDFVEENTCKQFILNFADRPDCLFTQVHQKLCIIFGQKSKNKHYIYTSNYKYWYKSERPHLLNGCSIVKNEFRHDGFIPKIGSEIEINIFRKIFTHTESNLHNLSQQDETCSIYLNMRATFYIKAFSHNPGSKEYKEFKFSEQNKDFVLCLLNSSLYFLFWTIISDCWHITLKELKFFYVPKICMNSSQFKKLRVQLEQRLEDTKKYIGSVQSEYEYKHKECFDILNSIDSELAKIYDLTSDELEYVQTYALKYRKGNDNA